VNRGLKILVLVVCSGLLMMSNCKQNTPEIDSETQSVVDHILAEQEFMRVFPTVNDRSIKQKGIGSSGKMLSDAIKTKFSFHDANLNTQNNENDWFEIDDDCDDDGSTNDLDDLSSFMIYDGQGRPTDEFKPNIDSVKISLEFDDNYLQDDNSYKNGRVITFLVKSSGNNIRLFGGANNKGIIKIKSFELKRANGTIEYNGNIQINSLNNFETLIQLSNGTCQKQGAWNTTFYNTSSRKITWMRGKNHSNNKDNFEEYKIEEYNGGNGSEGVSRDGTILYCENY
jgi:hypothetical protein